MATKSDESNTKPTEGAGLFGGSSSEKQEEVVPASEPLVKKDEPAPEAKGVESVTADVAQLSVDDKDHSAKPTEEEKATTTAASTTPSAPTTSTEPTAPIAPITDTVTPTTGPIWPETSPDHPLTKFYDSFEGLVAEAAHNEVYGIELSKSNSFLTKLILQKFLRANQNDLEKGKQQLLATLKWRKEFDPIKAANESFEKARFEGLGYILEVEGVPESPNKKDIVTFNIYGAVKDNKATFGDLQGYVTFLSSRCNSTS